MGCQVGNEVYSHVMSNGVQLDIREVPGFGNRSEVGFFIKEQCVGTFVVDKKRGGGIDIKPTMMRQQKIGCKNGDGGTEIPDDSTGPSLSDITSDE